MNSDQPTIRFYCMDCKVAYALPSEYAGEDAQCGCGSKLRIPELPQVTPQFPMKDGDLEAPEQHSQSVQSGDQQQRDVRAGALNASSQGKIYNSSGEVDLAAISGKSKQKEVYFEFSKSQKRRKYAGNALIGLAWLHGLSTAVATIRLVMTLVWYPPLTDVAAFFIIAVLLLKLFLVSVFYRVGNCLVEDAEIPIQKSSWSLRFLGAHGLVLIDGATICGIACAFGAVYVITRPRLSMADSLVILVMIVVAAFIAFLIYRLGLGLVNTERNSVHGLLGLYALCIVASIYGYQLGLEGEDTLKSILILIAIASVLLLPPIVIGYLNWQHLYHE